MGLQPSSAIDVFDNDLEDATNAEVMPAQKKARVECNVAPKPSGPSGSSVGSGGRGHCHNYETIKLV